jgi:hypothetical protein
VIETRTLSRSLAHGPRVAKLKESLTAGVPGCVDRFVLDMDILAEETRLQAEVLGSGDRHRNDLTGELSAPESPPTPRALPGASPPSTPRALAPRQ